jgi:hypothetical protein
MNGKRPVKLWPVSRAGALLASLVALFCLNARAAGTGPGDEGSVEAWDWCMQESVKAGVWAGSEAAAAVQSAYRDCRLEFKAVLQSLPDESKRGALRKKAADDQAMLIDFAKKMKRQGDPNK